MRPFESRAIIDDALIRMRRIWAPTTSGRRHDSGMDLSTVLVVDAIERALTAPSISDIADTLGVAASTASRLVDRAVSAAVVSKTASAEDPRRFELSLTATGEALSSKSRQFRDDYLAQVLTGWSNDDVARFADYLRRFATGVAATPPSPPTLPARGSSSPT